MNEDELSELLEEFETVSEIKDFFEQNCKNRALEPFDISVLIKAKKSDNQKKVYKKDILVKNIRGINNSNYNHKTPLYLINHEENASNALKAYINNPESLFEGQGKEKLSFVLVKDKQGNQNYFLDSYRNHRVIILLILSDVCEELSLLDVDVLEYQL